MLERMRQFYLIYPQLGSVISAPAVRNLAVPLLREAGGGKAVSLPKQISAPLVRKSSQSLALTPDLVLRFSWTQLIDLVRIDDPLKRAFTRPNA